MELLIVLAIISILMLLGIPSFQAIMKHVRELSAKKSLQTIYQAETMYNFRFPTKGFACSLSALGGSPADGAPTAAGAQLLPEDLASGTKDGYIFKFANCAKNSQSGTEHVDGYTVTAVPSTVGKTGDLGFCSDEGGVLRQDPNGGVSCSELVR